MRTAVRAGRFGMSCTCGIVGQLEKSLMPWRIASSLSTSKVSYGVPTAFRIWTTVFEKPHCGNILLPFMKSITVLELIISSILSFGRPTCIWIVAAEARTM